MREETENDFLSFCPYHGNTDSPAFSTSKRYGYSVCFNPSCAKGFEKRLSLPNLVRDIKKVNHIAAKRFILLNSSYSEESFQEKFDSIEDDYEPKPFPAEAIDKMHERFMNHSAAKEYMVGRGFEKVTMEHFNVGFSPASTGPVYREHDMIMVPAYTHEGMPVGLVGRSIIGKHFKNYGPEARGKGFHKSKIVWNLNNARRYSTVIICESTFDAMRIHQAGYPNVVALLGGSLSLVQINLLARHFDTIVIFTDDENKHNGKMSFPVHCAKCLRSGFDMCQGHRPGRVLGEKIIESLPRMTALWASYDDRHIYANHVKDASDMTDDEIRQCLRNAISHFEYLDWCA